MPVLLLMTTSVDAASGPDGSGTTLSMTLTEADNSTPMANASVTVYYWPFDPPQGTWFWLQQMGTATTDAGGNFSVPLNVSMVPGTGLADIGDGGDNAFNAVVYVIEPSGNYLIQNEVLQLGAAVSDSATAQGAGGENSAPIEGSTPPLGTNGNVLPGGFTGMSACNCFATKYRYVPVTALNSGNGISAHLDFTYNSSVAKQTVIGSTISNDEGASWQGNGSFTEQSDRGSSQSWNASDSYHNFIWANYNFHEYQFQHCGHNNCTPPQYEWVADHYAGQLTDDNPNWNGNGNVVGTVGYKVPSYTHNPNYYFILNSQDTP